MGTTGRVYGLGEPDGEHAEFAAVSSQIDWVAIEEHECARILLEALDEAIEREIQQRIDEGSWPQEV